MAKKQRRFRVQYILPVLGLVLVVCATAFFGGDKLVPSHAASGTYTCNSGDSLSGTNCIRTSTYAASQYPTTYTCNSGDSLSGTTCTHSYAATATYTCNSGDSLSGTTCTHPYPATYSCPSGGTLSGSTCTITQLRTTLSCPSGYTASGSACIKTYSATKSCTQGGVATATGCQNYYIATPVYSCPNGGSLANTICVSTYAAASHSGSYYCNNGDALSGSTCTHTLIYAATLQASGGGTSVSGSTSGSSSGTTRGSVSTKTTTGANGSVTLAPSVPPSAPVHFTAKVESSKVVSLSWSAGEAPAGIREFDIDRSSDSKTWGFLTSLTTTTYDDTSTDFNTQYYYRIKAVDNNNAVSDYATTSAKTDNFSGSSGPVVSDDKAVKATIADGTFALATSCSIGTTSGTPKEQGKTLLLMGPYNLLCVSEDGSTADSFNKPVAITLDLSNAPKGYNNYQVRLFDDTSSQAAPSTYDAKAHKLSFSLTANKSFAVYASKKKNLASTVILIIVLVVGLFGGLVTLRRRRGGYDTDIPALATTSVALAKPLPPVSPEVTAAFQQAVNRPSCTHLGMAQRGVQPQSTGCAECTAGHHHWKALRICLVCGHVGCSDDSSEQHALKHFQETGHPIIYEYGNPAGDTIGWCYIDQTYI